MPITVNTEGMCESIVQCLIDCGYLCDCCCGGVTPTPPIPPAEATCDVCDIDTTPDSIKVTFGTGTNLGGSQSGCSGDCDDWAAVWDCPQLTQTQVDTLNASCSAAFTDQPSPTAGCYYGLDSGIPCGADAIVVELTEGGSTGTALGAVTICSPGGYVRLDFQITSSVAGDDCLANFDTGGTGCDNIGYASDVSDPCDFIGAFFDWTLMDIEATSVAFRATGVATNVKEAFYVKKEGVIGINQEKLLAHIKANSNHLRSQAQKNHRDTQS